MKTSRPEILWPSFYLMNMPERKAESGFFWHIHHDRLVEWSDDIQRRIDYIHEYKEHKELRLRLLKPVQGQLPKMLIEARNKFERAREDYYNALNCYYRIAIGDSALHCNTNRARNEFDEARNEFQKTLIECEPALEELHKKECPGCPWNGVTIFP